jgi:hypothetical protein
MMHSTILSHIISQPMLMISLSLICKILLAAISLIVLVIYSHPVLEIDYDYSISLPLIKLL